jgi:hypothetical protein
VLRENPLPAVDRMQPRVNFFLGSGKAEIPRVEPLLRSSFASSSSSFFSSSGGRDRGKAVRRLLKYWSGPCCWRYWRWPRRERSVDIRVISAQRGRRGDPARANIGATLRTRGRRGGWPRHLLVAAHFGDAASLLAIHPFCLYARVTPVFQQTLERFLETNRKRIVAITPKWFDSVVAGGFV